MFLTIGKTVHKCSAAEHPATFDRSSRATDDCGKQASCFAMEATSDAGVLHERRTTGVPANPTFNLVIALVLWAIFQPRSLGAYRRRPPPLPKVTLAYRFCILLN